MRTSRLRTTHEEHLFVFKEHLDSSIPPTLWPEGSSAGGGCAPLAAARTERETVMGAVVWGAPMVYPCTGGRWEGD